MILKKDLQTELNRTKLILDYAREEIKQKDKEIERSHSIIKEVRELVEGVQCLGLRNGKTYISSLLNDILEILDKEKEI